MKENKGMELSERDRMNDKFEGCMYGQAVGDALGLGAEGLAKDGVEGYYPEGLTRYEQIVPDGHRCRWHRGAWTDDTDMMLCIVRALTAHAGRVDKDTLRDIARNFRAWETSPESMGIGMLVHDVLTIGDYVDKPQEVAKLFWNLSNKNNAPNGGLMRTSVVGLLRDNVADAAENICKLTHYDPRCVGSCVMAAEVIHSLVYQNRLLTADEMRPIGDRYDARINSFVNLAVNAEGIEGLELDEPSSAGYTLKTLSAAIWCLFHTNSFTEGMLAVVNAGGDADTNAAISCAILGARYGRSSIPAYYIDHLYKRDVYVECVDKLAAVLLGTDF
jgi:ADP-ribosylglycohydrolase